MEVSLIYKFYSDRVRQASVSLFLLPGNLSSCADHEIIVSSIIPPVLSKANWPIVGRSLLPMHPEFDRSLFATSAYLLPSCTHYSS